MKRIIISCVIVISFLFLEANRINAQTYNVEKNKISPAISTCKENLPIEYFNFHGINISTYYSIIDTVRFCRSANFSNYIIILSPITQEYGRDTMPCDKQLGKRLLVLIKSNSKGSYIDFVNENVIPNIFEFQSDPFVKLSSTQKKFSLELFTGSKIKCNYYFYFSDNEGEFYLDSMKYDCYVIDLSANEKKSYKFKRMGKNKLRRIDIHRYLYEPKL